MVLRGCDGRAQGPFHIGWQVWQAAKAAGPTRRGLARLARQPHGRAAHPGNDCSLFAKACAAQHPLCAGDISDARLVQGRLLRAA
jgi:hypothetical protein